MAIIRPAMRGFLSTPSGGAVVSPSDIFTGANDDWWDASTDTDMTFVAARTVDQYSITSEVATIRTTAAHGMLTGDSVVVAGVAAAVNGTFTVASAPTTTTLTYSVPGQGNIGDTAAAGTVNWEHRKISAWAGVMGNWTIEQATLANMPQYDATNKRVILTASRSYRMLGSVALGGAWASEPWSLWASVTKAEASPSTSYGIIGGQTATRRVIVVIGSALNMNVDNVGTLSYNNAAVATAATKFIVASGTPGGRSLWHNSTGTADASDALEGTPAWNGSSDQPYFFHDGPGSLFFNGSARYFGLKIGGTLTEQNRIDLKAWGEAQGDTYG